MTSNSEIPLSGGSGTLIDGSGSPNGSVSAANGTYYFDDSDGSLWKNNSSGTGTSWVEQYTPAAQVNFGQTCYASVTPGTTGTVVELVPATARAEDIIASGNWVVNLNYSFNTSGQAAMGGGAAMVIVPVTGLSDGDTVYILSVPSPGGPLPSTVLAQATYKSAILDGSTGGLAFEVDASPVSVLIESASSTTPVIARANVTTTKTAGGTLAVPPAPTSVTVSGTTLTIDYPIPGAGDPAPYGWVVEFDYTAGKGTAVSTAPFIANPEATTPTSSSGTQTLDLSTVALNDGTYSLVSGTAYTISVWTVGQYGFSNGSTALATTTYTPA